MKSQRFPSSRAIFLFLLGAVALGLFLQGEGCRRPAGESGGGQRVKTAAAPQRDAWYVYSFQGGCIGVGRSRVFHESENGEAIVRAENWLRIKVLREGTEAQQELLYTNISKPNGQLIRFESSAETKDQRVRTTGRVVGKRLEMGTCIAGRTEPSAIEWQPEFGGFDALEQSLRNQPIQPDGRRTLRALIPDFFEVATLELRAGDWEEVALPGGPQKLLRVDVLNQFLNGNVFRQTLWVDRAGECWKNQMEDSFEAFRTTKDQALTSEAEPRTDLSKATSVPLARPIANAHQTRKVRYRVRLAGGDPAKVFAVGPTQQVKSVDAHTVEITVFAVRPNQPGNPDAPADPPTADDRRPNSAVQSNDPRIEKLAREAAGEETDPWRLAVALERFVKGYMRLTDYSQVFSTAAEVAESRKGDCSEHAVLLAALCRAKGLPARVAVGLVYVEGSQEFAFHLWTEVYVGEKWIPLDGTLGRGGVGAAHLKLGQSNLQGVSRYSSFFPVIKVVGKLQIEVVEADTFQ